MPMARGRSFDDPVAAIAFAAELGGRVAVKADGLAAGKGVTVCADLATAEAAIREAMIEGVFGRAGRRVVVEEALTGPEASVIAICDATTCLAFPAARDHKRLGEGDTGPNTGGMGAFSPLPDLDARGHARSCARSTRRSWRSSRGAACPFRGALFAGLMLTPDGPRLLEFNVRFGDPETEALLPALDAPAGPAAGRGGGGPARGGGRGAGHRRHAAAGPARWRRWRWCSRRPAIRARSVPATPIDGIDGGARDRRPGVRRGRRGRPRRGHAATAGGRVLVVTGEGPDLAAAADAAYAAADHITFAGRQLRRDIGRAPVAWPRGRDRRGAGRDPALHPARDGRPVDGAGSLRGDAPGGGRRAARARAHGRGARGGGGGDRRARPGGRGAHQRAGADDRPRRDRVREPGRGDRRARKAAGCTTASPAATWWIPRSRSSAAPPRTCCWPPWTRRSRRSSGAPASTPTR